MIQILQVIKKIELRHLGGISLRDMAKIFNINKDKLRKIINRSLEI